jgi:hypothetical protein
MPTERELLALCLRWLEHPGLMHPFDKAMLIESLKTKLEPSRPWVPLTEEEQDACLDAGDCGGWRGVLHAVEAKLKEKNS